MHLAFMSGQIPCMKLVKKNINFEVSITAVLHVSHQEEHDVTFGAAPCRRLTFFDGEPKGISRCQAKGPSSIPSAQL